MDSTFGFAAPPQPGEDRGSDLLAERLTDVQREAILHTGAPLLIVAGPGAGKTKVMVHRTAYLVRERGVPPENLLVTTFTNKAAEELYDRLYPLLGARAGEVHISTLHSFCQLLLEEFPDAHPWGAGFQVLDDREQFLFVYARMGDLGLGGFPKARLGAFLSDVLSTFNICTEELVVPERFATTVRERGPSSSRSRRRRPRPWRSTPRGAGVRALPGAATG